MLVSIKVLGYSVLNTKKLLLISLLLMLQFGLLLRYQPYADRRLNQLELTVAGTNLVICQAMIGLVAWPGSTGWNVFLFGLIAVSIAVCVCVFLLVFYRQNQLFIRHLRR